MSEIVQIPVEVAAEAVVFDVVARGFDRRQVRARTAQLEQELAELRWQVEDHEAQRQALADERAAQADWTPSFRALGERAEQILVLADEEAAALREKARRQVRRWEREAAAELEAQRLAHAEALDAAKQAGERELRRLTSAAATQRELLEAELARARRDAELEITGRLNQAAAQAQDVRAQALRDAEQVQAASRAEVAHLQRRREELARELSELSQNLVAVLARLDRTDLPLEISTA